MKSNIPLISNLTPIRGIAALLVVIFHFEIVLVFFLPAEISLFFRKCYLMVDLFFIMSGFIISHVYGPDFSRVIQKAGFYKYLVARLARIYPLHLFTLCLMIIIVLVQKFALANVFDPRAIPTHLVLLQSFGIHSIYTWNIPAWSISAEFGAYLLFPLITIAISRYKNIAIPMMVLLMLISYCLIAFRFSVAHDSVAKYNLDVTYNFGWLRGIAGFLGGVLTYHLYLKGSFYFLKRDDSFIFLCVLLILSLHFGLTDLAFIPLFSLLVLSAAYNTGKVKKALDNRFMQWLGDVSFSIYLMQLPLMLFIIFITTRLGFPWKGPFSYHIPYWQAAIGCVLFLASLIGISAFTYNYIERPLRNWVNSRVQKKFYFLFRKKVSPL